MSAAAAPRRDQRQRRQPDEAADAPIRDTDRVAVAEAQSGATIARQPAASDTAASAIETAARPPRGHAPGRGRCRLAPAGDRRARSPSAAAIGRLSQKIVCQLATVRIRPPYSGPSTLPSSWTPPITPSGRPRAIRGPDVGDEAERHRHETAAPEPLERPARDHRAEIVRRRRHQRAGGEHREAEQQERPASVDVREASEQRHDHDVAEQEAADDRRRRLELVDADPDVRHDRREREHDHVRVDGRDQHRRRRDGEDPVRAACSPRGGRRRDRSRSRHSWRESRCTCCWCRRLTNGPVSTTRRSWLVELVSMPNVALDALRRIGAGQQRRDRRCRGACTRSRAAPRRCSGRRSPPAATGSRAAAMTARGSGR